jgi:archaeal flagellin FlaB
MGRKTKYLTERKNTAAIGIGAMIVFIAMVLVAGIAASVLVQTSTTLEMQALKTGSQTVSEVASGIAIEGVEGYTSGNSIERLAIEIKPRSGSPDVDLSTTIVEISDSMNKYVLNYSGTLTDSEAVNGNMFNSSFYPSSNTQTRFSIIVLQDADGSCTQDNPIINFGDHVVLAVDNCFSGISPRTDIFGQVISEEGAPGIIGFRTPASYTETILELQ